MKKPASGKRDKFLSAPLLLMCRWLGKGLGLVFSSFIILWWQPKIIIRHETQWELREKNQNVTTKERKTAEKGLRGFYCVSELEKGGLNLDLDKLPCEKDWNSEYCVQYLDQPLLTQWDRKHRDCDCSLRSMGMALGKCHIPLKLCPSCKIPYSLKTSTKTRI